MKYNVKQFIGAVALFTLLSCNNSGTNTTAGNDSTSVADTTAATFDTTFKVEAEAFADLQVLRYQVPGFNQLSLQQKQLAYYLYEAALCGRDIAYDQRGKNEVLILRTLNAAYGTYNGDKAGDDWKKFEEYCGRFWFSNGNHHHYGNEKFIPACSFEYFSTVVRGSDTSQLPKETGESTDAFLKRLQPIVYDLKLEPKLVDLSPNIDNIKASSVNFYEGVTQKEVEAFYSKFSSAGNAPSWGLNSKVVKENGQLVEKVWKVGGM
jgi:dipeptidyl-peptidase-3